MLSLLTKFERNRLFSEADSWMLFRLAAIAEACGWTMLIAGIGCERYLLPGNHIAVMIAGKIHGMLFLLYALAAAGLYPTLHWSRKRALAALLASVPPYGSLLFEQWASRARRSAQFRNYRYCLVLAALSSDS